MIAISLHGLTVSCASVDQARAFLDALAGARAPRRRHTEELRRELAARLAGPAQEAQEALEPPPAPPRGARTPRAVVKALGEAEAVLEAAAPAPTPWRPAPVAREPEEPPPDPAKASPAPVLPTVFMVAPKRSAPPPGRPLLRSVSKPRPAPELEVKAAADVPSGVEAKALERLGERAPLHLIARELFGSSANAIRMVKLTLRRLEQRDAVHRVGARWVVGPAPRTAAGGRTRRGGGRLKAPPSFEDQDREDAAALPSSEDLSELSFD